VLGSPLAQDYHGPGTYLRSPKVIAVSLRLLLLVWAVAAAIYFLLGQGIYIGSQLAVKPTPDGRRYYQVCRYLYPGRIRNAIVGEGATANEAQRNHSCSLLDR